MPYGPGGANDALARIVAQALSGKLASAVIVENKPGAGGALAVRAVKGANPDGRTMLLSTSITEIGSAKPKRLYDLTTDLDPVILSFKSAYLIISNTEIPVKTVRELIEYDHKNPGQLSYGSFGVGSGSHIAFELLKQRANISAVHVPYKSSAESTMAVIANQVQLGLDQYLIVGQQVEAGKVRALATTALTRDKITPNIPTVDESGVPGYNLTYTGGFLVPKGTPPETIGTLNAAINDELARPEVAAAVNQLGFAVGGGTTALYKEALDTNIQLYRRVIKCTGESSSEMSSVHQAVNCNEGRGAAVSPRAQREHSLAFLSG